MGHNQTENMGKGAVDAGMLGKIGAGCAVLSCCCVCLGLFLPYIFATTMTPNDYDVTANAGLFGMYYTANNDNDVSKNWVSCQNEDSGCTSTSDKTKYIDYNDQKGMPDDYCDTTGDGDGGKAYKNGNDTYKSMIDGICTGRGLYIANKWNTSCDGNNTECSWTF